MSEASLDIPLADYRLAHAIAPTGEHGAVFLAYEPSKRGHPRKLAITALDAAALRAPVRKALEEQWQVCADLSHPVLTHVVDWGEERGVLWVANEWLDGVDLGEIARGLEGPFSPRVVASLGLVLADAMQYLHEARRDDVALGLVHGRLNPRRVMLLQSGYLKLLGFAGPGASAAVLLPKPNDPVPYAYLAPEQLGADAPDARSDLYSLALLLTRFLTSTNPLQRDSVAATHMALIAGVPAEVLAGNPLAEALLPCLAVDPSQRPGSLRWLSMQLEKLLSDLGGPCQASDWREIIHDHSTEHGRELALSSSEQAGRILAKLQRSAVADPFARVDPFGPDDGDDDDENKTEVMTSDQVQRLLAEEPVVAAGPVLGVPEAASPPESAAPVAASEVASVPAAATEAASVEVGASASASESAPTESRAGLKLLVMVVLAFGASFGGVAFSIFQVRFLYSAFLHGGL